MVAMDRHWVLWKVNGCYGTLIVAFAIHCALNKFIAALKSQWLLCESMVVRGSHCLLWKITDREVTSCYWKSWKIKDCYGSH
jgi:hypothetical protein